MLETIPTANETTGLSSIFTLNATFASGNQTLSEPCLTWNLPAVFCVLTLISGLVFNGVLLYIFAKNQSLRTPFNIYLINLLIANIISLLVEYPFNVMLNLYSSKWVLGRAACNLYVYHALTEAVVFNSHQLIALNRAWAVVFPVNYRHHHSRRTACLFCLGVWVYVSVYMVPGLVVDALYYPIPLDLGYLMNSEAQPVWSGVMQPLLFDLPQIIVVVSYLVICVTSLVRHWKGRRDTNAISPIFALEIAVTPGTRGAAKISPPLVPSRRLKKSRKLNQGFLVLTLLTISVMICWTPNSVYYTIVMADLSFKAPVFWQIQAVLFACQTILDPVLFVLALRSLREALFNVLLAPLRSSKVGIQRIQVAT